MIFIWSNALIPMPMVPRFAQPLRRNCVSVVESHQPLSVRAVQRKRIAETMWPLRRWWNPHDDKANPVAPLRIDHENLPVEIEKQIEGRILAFAHS